ncbi:pentatricopeptide (PPR) repeat-containing protein [Wolffia australiana]
MAAAAAAPSSSSSSSSSSAGFSHERRRQAFSSVFVNGVSSFAWKNRGEDLFPRHASISIQEPTPKGKTSVWINPNNPRASRLRSQSSESRFARLSQLAETLDSSHPLQSEVEETLDSAMVKPSEQDAVILLNHMTNPETAVLALRWLRRRIKARKDVVLFNVALKVTRKAKNWPAAETLLGEMLDCGVAPDNVTFSTAISCARLCNLPEKAVFWFERMPEFDCAPDDVTYSAMIDAYGRSGEVAMAMKLYDRAREEKRRLDPVTFSTVIKVYSSTNNFDGALNVYEEMKALGVKPNLITFNTLLDAMGRASRPWQVKTIFREMESSGLSPSRATHAALLRAYARARYPDDALKVYREMKDKNLEMTVVLCNTLLAMCADLGLVEEALEIFKEMKSPDSWTFSSMITIYSCSGGVAEAEALFEEMISSGFEPNIFVLTSLVQCYGKAKKIDSVGATFERMLQMGITPDERFCGCLLNVLAEAPEEERAKVQAFVARASTSLGGFVEKLMDKKAGEEALKAQAEELFLSVGREVNKAYCNCLIDLCLKGGRVERACLLLDVALRLGIYTGLQAKSATQWSLNVRSLSLGAAMTALRVWMSDLWKAMEDGEELPPLLGINTGHGKHRYSDKGLASAFDSELRKLSAPFHEAPDKVGWFLTTRVAAKAWLESLNSPARVKL